MSAKNSQILKQLQTRKAKLEVDVAMLKEESKAAQRKFSEAASQLESVVQQIESMKEKRQSVTVTEHAVIRYLERVKGLDLAEIRREIMSDETEAMVRAMGNGKYPIHSGVKAVVKDMCVVSVA